MTKRAVRLTGRQADLFQLYSLRTLLYKSIYELRERHLLNPTFTAAYNSLSSCSINCGSLGLYRQPNSVL